MGWWLALEGKDPFLFPFDVFSPKIAPFGASTLKFHFSGHFASFQEKNVTSREKIKNKIPNQRRQRSFVFPFTKLSPSFFSLEIHQKKKKMVKKKWFLSARRRPGYKYSILRLEPRTTLEKEVLFFFKKLSRWFLESFHMGERLSVRLLGFDAALGIWGKCQDRHTHTQNSLSLPLSSCGAVFRSFFFFFFKKNF